MLIPLLRLTAIVFLSSLLFGCSDPNVDIVYVDVKLRILLNDQPLTDANVMLVPRKLHDSTGKVTPFSMGTTDQHGQCAPQPTAHLENQNYAVGISPGVYSVIISKPLPANKPREKNFLPQEGNFTGEWELFAANPNEVPACFHRSDTLTLEIPKVQTFEHQFELQSRCP